MIVQLTVHPLCSFSWFSMALCEIIREQNFNDDGYSPQPTPQWPGPTLYHEWKHCKGNLCTTYRQWKWFWQWDQSCLYHLVHCAQIKVIFNSVSNPIITIMVRGESGDRERLVVAKIFKERERWPLLYLGHLSARRVCVRQFFVLKKATTVGAVNVPFFSFNLGR